MYLRRSEIGRMQLPVRNFSDHNIPQLFSHVFDLTGVNAITRVLEGREGHKCILPIPGAPPGFGSQVASSGEDPSGNRLPKLSPPKPKGPVKREDDTFGCFQPKCSPNVAPHCPALKV